MKFQIDLENPPAGYTLGATKKGKIAKVAMREFTSSEDGDAFVTRLEGFPDIIIGKLPPNSGVYPAMVDTLLAIIDRNGTADIYVNELCSTTVRLNKDVDAGSAIYEHDVLDVTHFGIVGVDIPSSSGFAVVFSKGWRKGFFYDFAPINEPYAPRDFDPSEILGHYYTYLSYQDIFKLTEDTWQILFANRWFPFVGLPLETCKRMIMYAKSGWLFEDLIPTISAGVHELCQVMIEKWSRNPVFEPHKRIIETALQRYLSKDYISAVSILYPRIEGIMRSIHERLPNPKRVSQNTLAESAVPTQSSLPYRFSRLLPEKFRQYVQEVYFANFAPGQPASASRNSIGHGVAVQSDYSLKSASIAILILDQIFYYHPTVTKDSEGGCEPVYP